MLQWLSGDPGGEEAAPAADVPRAQGGFRAALRRRLTWRVLPADDASSSDAVIAACGIVALAVWLAYDRYAAGASAPAPRGVDYLVGHDLIGIFEDGWAALHREVSLFVGEALLAVLRGVRTGESGTLAGLHGLQRSLETHLEAGTPWLARDALDVLAALDAPAWSGLLGLLSECPIIPDAVTAIVERRTGRVDPSAFAFVATNADIDVVRAFMARVPQLLAC